MLLEFGELANETRGFKFCLTEQTSERNCVLEEYIDCLFMPLYFCNIANVSLSEDFPNIASKDIIETFLMLYEYGIDLSRKFEKETIKNY